MHTPGHAVINLAAIGGALDGALSGPILAGAIVPDLPIAVLYVRERWIRGTPEDRIWSDHYQRRFWQDLIHGLHSIPIGLLGLGAGVMFGVPAASAFFASLLLHAGCDLPVHGKDAHRHLFPLSDYRFTSPLSYWDREHHATWVALVEMLLVFAAAVWLWPDSSPLGRATLALVLVGYLTNYGRHFLAPVLLRRRSPS